MLAGHNDLDSLQLFPFMVRFSDDGMTLHGAYGQRWFDQLDAAYELLRENPSTRRCFYPTLG